MFAGTRVKLEIFSPTLTTPIITPAEQIIDDEVVEFDNTDFFDIAGDPFNVAAGQFDVRGTLVSYTLLESGFFSNVDDATGFNGYALTFEALTRSGGLTSIREARLLDAQSTFSISQDRISFDADTLFVNVDGLPFSIQQTMNIQLSFEIRGTARSDWLTGEAGNDRMVGAGGRDHLAGGGGDDVLLGGRGSDTLDGGSGLDRLIGGAGADHFVLRRGGQSDTVVDFEDGADRILVRTSAESFDDLILRQSGNDVFISDGGASLRIANISLANLTASDFLF